MMLNQIAELANLDQPCPRPGDSLRVSVPFEVPGSALPELDDALGLPSARRQGGPNLFGDGRWHRPLILGGAAVRKF